jgi:Right handed beta helix region
VTTQSINAAIAALGTAGGVVLLPPGVVTLTGTIRMTRGVELRGSGRFATTLQTSSHAFDLITMANQTTLRDLTLRGPGVRDTATYAKCVNGGACNDVVIEHCRITGACGQGIAVGDNSARGLVRDCEIDNNGDEGLYGGYAVDRWLIEGNHIHDNQKCGVDLGGAYNRILGNHFAANGRAGDGTDNEEVLLNGTHAANPRRCVGNVVSGNTFEGGTRWTIAVRLTTEGYASGVCTDNVIANNTITDCYIGVEARIYTAHCIIANNTIRRSSLWALNIEAGATDMVVANNSIQ